MKQKVNIIDITSTYQISLILPVLSVGINITVTSTIVFLGWFRVISEGVRKSQTNCILCELDLTPINELLCLKLAASEENDGLTVDISSFFCTGGMIVKQKLSTIKPIYRICRSKVTNVKQQDNNGLAYYLYSPLPSNAVEPWKQMCIRAVVRARTGETFGIASSINITRFFLEAGNIVRSYDTGLKVQDVKFSGVPVRLYIPSNVVNMSSALIYIHGGGWALLSVGKWNSKGKSNSNRIYGVSIFIQKSGIVTVSFEYRRSPEHVFPVPLEDCLSAVKYFIANAESFGVDPHRIAISDTNLQNKSHFYIVNP
ncbi:hypothetical protein KUTeg_010600 [Tegillarca granosa]|uniref:BD-FAE-like domain-containing protein n=1 Tax=Tegillarca granosa TaxID=220873 RepID=A0ABQ9F3D9_TEGGR|nr:hypothetical protein KUTeg_010600 [Tegillarca granosa]